MADALWHERGVPTECRPSFPLSGSSLASSLLAVFGRPMAHLAAGLHLVRFGLEAADQVPLPGSYSSAEAAVVETADAASHEHRAIGQQRGRVVGVGLDHAPRWRSTSGCPGRTARRRPACRRADAATLPPATSTVPSGSSVAVWPYARRDHDPGGGPGPAARVVQLGGGQDAPMTAVAARHEHRAIGQQRGRVVDAGRRSCSRWRSRSRCRVVQLGGGQRSAVVVSRPPRAPCHRAAAWPCGP